MASKAKYTSDLPHRLYTFFIGYTGIGAPSFSKFAVTAGITLADVQRFRRKHKEFERAYEECNEIRRDYLIDNALSKKTDSSLTKFLLSSEYGMDERESDPDEKRLEVTVEVIDSEAEA